MNERILHKETTVSLKEINPTFQNFISRSSMCLYARALCVCVCVWGGGWVVGVCGCGCGWVCVKVNFPCTNALAKSVMA